MDFENIYKKLRQIRIEKGFSQKALGEKCGLTQQAINRIEQGQRKIDLDLLLRMSEALKVSVSEILSYDNMIGNVTSSGDIVYMDSDVAEYNRIIEKQKNGEGFTPYDRHFISDYLDKNPLDRIWFIENGLKSKEKKLNRIQSAYERLNENGRKEAVKRIEELTEIERYTKPDEWFKGRPTKEEIDKAVTAYLNEDNPPEPPKELSRRQ